MSSNKNEKSIRKLIRLTKKELKDLQIQDLLADPELNEAFKRAKPKHWSELTKEEREAHAKEQAEAEQKYIREQRILRIKKFFQLIMRAKRDEPNSKLFTTAEELLEFVVKYESNPSSVSHYEWNKFETILLTRLESLLQADGNEEPKKKFSVKKIGAIVVSSVVILTALTTLILNLEKIWGATGKQTPSSKTDQQTMSESPIYRDLSPNIRRKLTLLLQKFRERYNDINMKISVTSDKGSQVRHRVAEEIAAILTNAGFETKTDPPIIRFSSDTSDVVIKFNENDTELVKNFCKVLNRFFKSTSFSANKSTNLQRYELQIIVAGDPLFLPDGVVTFQ